MEYYVTNCSNCPFSVAFLMGNGSEMSSSRCFHPYKQGKGNNFGIVEDTSILPEWCPLKQEYATIALKQQDQ